MASLFVHPEAYGELDALYDVDEDAAGLIDALLESLGDNPRLLARLFRPDNHFKHNPPFEVKEYVSMNKRGMFILIFKVRSPEGALLPFRVLVGYNGQQDHFHVLGVSHREESYDSDQFTADVIRRYGECRLPVIPSRA